MRQSNIKIKQFGLKLYNVKKVDSMCLHFKRDYSLKWHFKKDFIKKCVLFTHKSIF